MATNASNSSTSTVDSETSFTHSSLQSYDFQQTALGFLDLPTEIRLEIYGYFLLAPPASSPRTNETSYKGLRSILPVILSPESWTVGGQPIASLFRLYPAILSTCRAIHEEATEVLYGKNLFQFSVPDEANNEIGGNISILEQSENVFKFNNKDWRWRSDGPLLLRDSTFACFLNSIGPGNAASLTAIEFVAPSGENNKYQFQLMTTLLARHVLGLKFIRVSNGFEWRINGDWPRCLAPAGKDEELHQICRTLTDLVRGCPSLEEFEYRGSFIKPDSELEAKTGCLGKISRLLEERKAKNAPRMVTSQEKEKGDETES